MDKQKSIESLQFFVTNLAEDAIVHKDQASMRSTRRSFLCMRNNQNSDQ